MSHGGGQCSFFPSAPWTCPVRCSHWFLWQWLCFDKSVWKLQAIGCSWRRGKEGIRFLVYLWIYIHRLTRDKNAWVLFSANPKLSPGWWGRWGWAQKRPLVPSWGCLQLVVTLMASVLECLPWIWKFWQEVGSHRGKALTLFRAASVVSAAHLLCGSSPFPMHRNTTSKPSKKSKWHDF